MNSVFDFDFNDIDWNVYKKKSVTNKPSCTICGTTKNLMPLGKLDKAYWCFKCYKQLEFNHSKKPECLPIQYFRVNDRGIEEFMGFIRVVEDGRIELEAAKPSPRTLSKKRTHKTKRLGNSK